MAVMKLALVGFLSSAGKFLSSFLPTEKEKKVYYSKWGIGRFCFFPKFLGGGFQVSFCFSVS